MSRVPENRLFHMPRLGIVVIGAWANETGTPLFRKLRPHGVYYSRVKPASAMRAFMQPLAERAADEPQAYGHWQIDGNALTSVAPSKITTGSLLWASLYRSR